MRYYQSPVSQSARRTLAGRSRRPPPRRRSRRRRRLFPPRAARPAARHPRRHRHRRHPQNRHSQARDDARAARPRARALAERAATPAGMMLQRGGSVRHVQQQQQQQQQQQIYEEAEKEDDGDAAEMLDAGFFGGMDGDEEEDLAAENLVFAAFGKDGDHGHLKHISRTSEPAHCDLAKAANAAAQVRGDIETSGGAIADDAGAALDGAGGHEADAAGKHLESSSALLDQAYVEDDFEDIIATEGLDAAVTLCILPDLSSASTADLRALAIACEKSELYEDMRVVMRQLVNRAGELASEEERHLLATAYKNVVGARRASWRQLWEKHQAQKRQEEAERAVAAANAARAQRELKDDPDDPFGDLDKVDVPPFVTESLNSLNGIDIDDTGSAYPLEDQGDRSSPLVVASTLVREELEDTCLELIEMLRGTLLPGALNAGADADAEAEADAETVIFYQKLIADYYRYLAEHMRERDRKDYVAGADSFYSEALELAASRLQPANPLLLGLALNVSVFYFEVLNLPDKACQLAKEKHDAAARFLESAPDTDKEASLLLDLLRENLTVWTLSET